MRLAKRSKRQSFLGTESDAIFARSVIGIVGLCGGGSHIAQQLAYIGVENLNLFDPDHTDFSNLNRMVGSTPVDAEHKRLKTDVISDIIRHIRPSAIIKKFPQKWQDAHIALRECTAVFGCVDSFSERDQLEAYCRRFLIPYIDVGMDVHESADHQYSISGQVIASLPGKPCMRCMGFITEDRIAEETKRYGDAGDRPQVVWPNGVLASTAVGIFVGLVAPWRSPQEFIPFLEYDGNRHEVRTSNVLLVMGSKRCPHYLMSDEIGDPFWGTATS